MSFEPEAIRAFEHAGWQRAASTYGNSFAHATVPYIAPLLEAAEISPGQHVLDVACGPGHLAAAACARGATVHGLDFSAEMVAIARSAHPEVVVTEGDAENLPYPDNTFHAVVSSFGIHHVPRPELALAAIADDIDGQAERFRRDENLAIPIAAVLARGRKTAD